MAKKYLIGLDSGEIVPPMGPYQDPIKYYGVVSYVFEVKGNDNVRIDEYPFRLNEVRGRTADEVKEKLKMAIKSQIPQDEVVFDFYGINNNYGAFGNIGLDSFSFVSDMSKVY